MLAAHEPDYYSLVLMDLQMPVLDGYETTKRLRAGGRYPHLPIVAMTAHVMMEEQERCLALGMRGHIGKPIDPDELYRVVSSFCKREPAAKAPPPAKPGGPLLKTVPLEPRKREPRRRRPGCPPVAGLDAKAGLARTRGNQKLYDEPAQAVRERFPVLRRRAHAAPARRQARRGDAARAFAQRRGGQRRRNAGRPECGRARTTAAPRRGVETALANVERELRPVMGGLAEHFGIEPDVAAQPRAAERPTSRRSRCRTGWTTCGACWPMATSRRRSCGPSAAKS